MEDLGRGFQRDLPPFALPGTGSAPCPHPQQPSVGNFTCPHFPDMIRGTIPCGAPPNTKQLAPTQTPALYKRQLSHSSCQPAAASFQLSNYQLPGASYQPGSCHSPGRSMRKDVARPA